MKRLLIAGLVGVMMGLCILAFAETRYNPFENRYETASDCDVLKYNAFENKYSYEHENSQLEYNAFENEYEWNDDCED